MNPLMGLPKTIFIETSFTFLEIKNHIVTTHQCLMQWLVSVARYGDLDQIGPHIRPHMIQQGFRFDAFIEECIRNMQDPKMFAFVFFWYRVYDPANMLEKFSATKTAAKIALGIIIELKKCHDWDQLFDLMNADSDFSEEIKNRIQGGVKQCNL